VDLKGLQVLIDVIAKSEAPMKFHFQVADRDTSFTYDVQGIDSLRFGLFDKRQFEVMNENEHIWWYD
jgi:hypothetical protein